MNKLRREKRLEINIPLNPMYEENSKLKKDVIKKKKANKKKNG